MDGENDSDHSRKSSTLEIRVTAQTIAEKVHHLAAFARGNIAFAHCLFSEISEATDEFFGVVFDVA